MKTIRHKVFETNSSSTHSISISDEVELLESITPNAEGVIELTGGQFGWGWVKFNDALTKANYCAIDAKYHYETDIHHEIGKTNLDLLKEVIQKQTGAEFVICTFTDDYNSNNRSYIDHESVGTSRPVFENEDTLRNFIFNPNCWLYIGNDNEEAPVNFFDSPNTNYKYVLKLGGMEAKFKEKPSDEEFKEMLEKLTTEYCDSISGGIIFGDMKVSGSDYPDWKCWEWEKVFDKNMNVIKPFSKISENKVIIYNDQWGKTIDLGRDEDENYKGKQYLEVKEIDFTLEEIA